MSPGSRPNAKKENLEPSITSRPRSTMKIPATTRSLPSCMGAQPFMRPQYHRWLRAARLSSRVNQFNPRKEISDFERGSLRSVGAVDAVALDVAGVEFADRSRRGLGWVGRAHDLA